MLRLDQLLVRNQIPKLKGLLPRKMASMKSSLLSNRRAYVAREVVSGSGEYQIIQVHHGGHPENIGRILARDYLNKESVDNLMDRGDIEDADFEKSLIIHGQKNSCYQLVMDYHLPRTRYKNQVDYLYFFEQGSWHAIDWKDRDVDIPSSAESPSQLIYELHNAIAENDPLAVERLVAAGANVNGFREGQTPLHVAARFGHADCYQILLDLGADPHIEDDSYLEPQEVAYRLGHDDCVKKKVRKRSRP